MQQIVQVIRDAFFCIMITSVSVMAQEAPSAKNTTSLAEFGAKLQSLEDVVDAITMAGALALLTEKYPEWTFDRAAGFDGLNSHITNDIGAVAGDYEYGLSKVRGAIFRNKSVSDEHRERALELFGSVKEYVPLAYEMERLVTSGDMASAGDLYRTEILQRAEALDQSIAELSKEIEQAIKFSSL